MIVSRRIHEIPQQQDLFRRLLAYAKIDRIMNPDPDDCMVRVYHYDKEWVPGGHFFKIDDSGGDHYYALFSSDGCIVKGFDHESDLSPWNREEGEKLPDIVAKHDFYAGAPARLSMLLDDPALEKHLTTFCVWQTPGDSDWRFAGSEFPADWNDGINTFLYYIQELDGYKEWFGDYYGQEPDMNAIRSIFEGKPVTAKRVRSLNPEGDTARILQELEENF